MPYDPTAPSRLGRTGLSLTRLGLGAASIGGLYEDVTDAHAIATIDRAWELGIRTFDVAPLYGYGAAERRVGMALAGRPRDEFVLSTKVGRLVRPAGAVGPASDHATPGGPRKLRLFNDLHVRVTNGTWRVTNGGRDAPGGGMLPP